MHPTRVSVSLASSSASSTLTACFASTLIACFASTPTAPLPAPELSCPCVALDDES